MVNEADLITASDLNRRLSVANPHDELGRLAVVFNMTLARLQDSFVALDRFVADASHELLTPLTTLRSVGEVGLRSVRSPEEYREIIGSMLEETQRLQLLVEKLLQLARAEGGAEVVELSPVRIDEVASDAVEDARILAEEKHQRISLRASECTAQTDRLFLRQALQNILDNAIKYSPANSEIGVTVSESEDMISIAVTDHGQGVSTAARERLTDRFFCAEPSRDRRRGGYGLGLAITKAYMRVLGGALEYRPGFPSGSRFELRLPVRRSAAGALSPL
jgi:signal transduction histidine kinase